VALVSPTAARPDWTIDQDWQDYGAHEHATWDLLFARQRPLLAQHVAQPFLRGLEQLGLDRPGIPDFRRLNERLEAATGWQVVTVPGLVPEDVFFSHLARRRFVSARFLRRRDQLDYLQEPDIFHDAFGHLPMLADPRFADYMEAYGWGGLRALELGTLERFARLYWYTVEFGLLQEPDGLRIYGAGIVSSHGESRFALHDPSPHRVRFDLERILRTDYRIDDYQQTYFVIDSLETLLRATLELDFRPLLERLKGLPDLGLDALLETDVVLQRGTQAHARRRGFVDAA
jgi:phenylalanine-4-hydroxylase